MIYIDPSWNYKQTLLNLKTLRRDYMDVLASFSYFNLHDKVEFEYKIKNDIYSLQFETWKKDRIWEYMNHDVPYTILQKFK